MATEKLTASEIQEIIVSSFVDAGDYLNFMQAVEMDNVDGAEWAKTNKVEIEDEREFKEAISRIQEDFRQAALARMEADIKGYEFDQDDTRLPLFRQASRDEIAAIAELNYDEARERIENDGTLF